MSSPMMKTMLRWCGPQHRISLCGEQWLRSRDSHTAYLPKTLMYATAGKRPGA
jgi:hypothetical protein